jgi:NADH-ubiquinone oxidoreductase chain 1
MIEIQKSIYFLFLVPPLYMIFYIAAIAETNRAPFDLAEAESELVSGFMTEHAAGIFVFFFLAEYASIILICILITIVFIGGYEILSFLYLSPEFIYPILYIINILYESLISILNINDLGYINEIKNNFIYSINYLSEVCSDNNTLSLGYPLNLGIKSFTLVFLFILIRASYPRLRFDKLMSCC